MVDVVRVPARCAARTISSQRAPLIFSGQILWRVGSTRISAAVPQSVPCPASRRASKIRPSVQPLRCWMKSISCGE
ncbi:hypothetical protein Cabther_B0741 [Chloracidobacterium thermophilum B]|uniref:Uncharacterized protein n=1 Tax=Chloracidobacterium thermophilum (strain B) TaxID=981222 RepID=G2LL62_CHLTF|nr:hypothetical protein Cabther_B0741 [Chloracidobacterium thermophilum B]